MNHTTRLAVLVTSAVLFISGCISTHVRGFSDRDYRGYKIQKVAVRAPNAGFSFGETLETSMVKQLQAKGVKARSFLKSFPPTREWTNQEISTELMKDGYDSIMYINLIGSDTSTQTIGYIHNGNAYAYGNMATYSGSSTPMTAISRYTSTRVKIYDVKNAKVIWVGDSSTNAGGLLYMSDETQADSIATEITTALQESGHM